MYTSVYKDSTAFWPAASGTQCKAKIRVTYTWGKERREGKKERSNADSNSQIAQLAPHTQKKKIIHKEKLTAYFHSPTKKQNL